MTTTVMTTTKILITAAATIRTIDIRIIIAARTI
jgi:hypothetical protein